MFDSLEMKKAYELVNNNVFGDETKRAENQRTLESSPKRFQQVDHYSIKASGYTENEQNQLMRSFVLNENEQSTGNPFEKITELTKSSQKCLISQA